MSSEKLTLYMTTVYDESTVDRYVIDITSHRRRKSCGNTEVFPQEKECVKQILYLVVCLP